MTLFLCPITLTTQVGSIAAGGRYDGLVGMFSRKEVNISLIALIIIRITRMCVINLVALIKKNR